MSLAYPTISRMKVLGFLALVLCTAGVTGCKPAMAKDPRTEIQRVEIAEVQPADAGSRGFTGVVTARVQSDLGFRVPGKITERLVDAGPAVYPMNPKAAERYRDRKAPSGAKDDALDAWSFADALRTDGHGWRPLLAQDPLTTELRLLCRDEIKLIEQRTALVNQLRAALCEYYPAALAAFDDWTAEGPWRFVIAFPDPPALAPWSVREFVLFESRLSRHGAHYEEVANYPLA